MEQLEEQQMQEIEQALQKFDMRVARLKKECLIGAPQSIIDEELRLIKNAAEYIKELKFPKTI